MAKTLQQIEQQITDLQRKAETLRQRETQEVIERIRVAIDHSQLTMQDLFGTRAAKGRRKGVDGKTSAASKPVAAGRKRGRRTVPVKYRDEHGNTWAARGSRPKWLVAALAAGRKLEDFLIK